MLLATALGVSCTDDGGAAVRDNARQVSVDGMMYIPPGDVRMGTDSVELDTVMERFGLAEPGPLLMEIPRRRVRVAGFYLDSTEVTNRAFAAFVTANSQWSQNLIADEYHNGNYLEHWYDDQPSVDDLDHPVTFVTWWAGAAFCKWQGKRLPTEAEWEWAAQGGDTTATFPWGSDFPDSTHANWGGNAIDATVPVASYPPNGYGLYDLAGNVWEFLVNPWYGAYHETPLAQPSLSLDTLDRVQTRRVVRGGSWGASVVNMRVRYRDSHRPFDAGDIVGFRCARSAHG